MINRSSWWFRPIILGLWRPKQENGDFKVNLSDVGRLLFQKQKVSGNVALLVVCKALDSAPSAHKLSIVVLTYHPCMQEVDL